VGQGARGALHRSVGGRRAGGSGAPKGTHTDPPEGAGPAGRGRRRGPAQIRWREEGQRVGGSGGWVATEEVAAKEEGGRVDGGRGGRGGRTDGTPRLGGGGPRWRWIRGAGGLGRRRRPGAEARRRSRAGSGGGGRVGQNFGSLSASIR
jgi:hypothetical protein